MEAIERGTRGSEESGWALRRAPRALLRRIVTRLWVLALMAFMAAGGSAAQESTSFKIQAAVLNAGGRPLGGASPASPAFLIRPDAIGEGLVAGPLGSASYRLSSGFVHSFPPPGEVQNLIFTDEVTLEWDPQAMAAHYHLYRSGPMGPFTATLPIADCLPPDVAGTTTTSTQSPALHQAYFYLVNAVSLTNTEGPKGTNGVHCP